MRGLDIDNGDRIELYNSYGKAILIAKISSKALRKIL